MKSPEFFVIKKKKSPAKALIVTASAVVTVAAAATVVYKMLKNKIKTNVLGHVDLDGDGELDSIMLDTTGNGEIDTIILNPEIKSDDAVEVSNNEETN